MIPRQEAQSPCTGADGGVYFSVESLAVLVDPGMLGGGHGWSGHDETLLLRASLALLVRKTTLLQGGRAGGHVLGRPASGTTSIRRVRQLPRPAPTGPLGRALDLVVETHLVALRCVVLRAVGDLGLAVVQDTPDDGDAGHVLPAADQVLGLLKGHDPAGCKEPGTGQGSWPQSLLSPRPPSGPARPTLQESACHPSLGRAEEGAGKVCQEKLTRLEQCPTNILEGSGQRKEAGQGQDQT